MNCYSDFIYCADPSFDFIVVGVGYGVDVLCHLYLMMDVSNKKFLKLNVVEKLRRNIC